MPSQNELIHYLAKKAYLGCIIDETRINLKITMAHEKTGSKVIPRDVKNDVEVIPISSTSIRRIKVEYLKAEAEKNKAALVDFSPVLDTDTLHADSDPWAFGGHLRVYGPKVVIAAPRRDTDQLKSTNLSMSFRLMGILDVPEMPPATTKDDVWVEEAVNPESKVEKDEEMLEVTEEASYEGLTEIEEGMVDAVMKDSLADTPLTNPSRPTKVDMTLGIDAQDQSVASGTNALTDGVTV
ncbi:hypothetical protein H5410_030658 [Solanum commersonii]|uniref:Polyprotein protein n=1 Tax=Solanum commersonii TaxID=4109 RepID=A0A9J5YI14_SOLCO|nr:hypothetical protein H5410_030658 [Solanum commersonii]